REEDTLPLQAATWLYFAGDYAGAARAYAGYRASPAGSAEGASGMDRLLAAVMGARAARESKDPALAERFVQEAIGDLPLLRADLPSPYPRMMFMRALLSVAGEGPTRARFLEQALALEPEVVLQWAQEGNYRWGARRGAAGLAPEELRELLKRMAGSPNFNPSNAEQFAQILCTQNLVNEAADLYLRAVGNSPGLVRPYMAIDLANRLEHPQQNSGGEEETHARILAPEAPGGAAPTGNPA